MEQAFREKIQAGDLVALDLFLTVVRLKNDPNPEFVIENFSEKALLLKPIVEYLNHDENQEEVYLAFVDSFFEYDLAFEWLEVFCVGAVCQSPMVYDRFITRFESKAGVGVDHAGLEWLFRLFLDIVWFSRLNPDLKKLLSRHSIAGSKLLTLAQKMVEKKNVHPGLMLKAEEIIQDVPKYWLN